MVYACSDLHGQFELYSKIKAYLKPEDIVYCLGDCGDRGPEPWKTIKAVYLDPQFIYLKGNHEEMLVNAMRLPRNDFNYELLSYNGGVNTFSQWEKEVDSFGWTKRLSRLPLRAEYTNSSGKKILLSHAGFTPTVKGEPSPDDLLWNRSHFFDKWDEENFPDTYVVHGHTPIPFVFEEVDPYAETMPFAAKWYCNGRKVCLDMGSYATGMAILLNLDTFEEWLFTTESCPFSWNA